MSVLSLFTLRTGIQGTPFCFLGKLKCQKPRNTPVFLFFFLGGLDKYFKVTLRRVFLPKREKNNKDAGE